MTFAALLAFNLTLLAAIASPGPSLLFLSRTAMVQGRRAGVAAALGLGLMAAIWTAAALLGLNALFAVVPWAYTALKIAGALYLIWLAVQTWRTAKSPVGAEPVRRDGRIFLNAMLVNLANPKSVLFAGAVLIVIFPPQLASTDKALIFINHLAVEWIVQPALAVALSSPGVRRRYLAAKAGLDRSAAVLLGGLGLRLLLDPGPK